jgi:hypothetical protein
LVGNNYFFIEEPSGKISSILQKQGLSEDDLEYIGQDMNTPIVDEETAKRIAKKLRLSIYQRIYQKGNPVPPVPIIVKLQLNAKERPAPFLLLVQLPDERVGMITMSTDILEPIPYDKIPRPNIHASIAQKKDYTQIGP